MQPIRLRAAAWTLLCVSLLAICVEAVLPAEALAKGRYAARQPQHPWVNQAYLDGVKAHQAGNYDVAIGHFETAARTLPYSPNIPYYIGDTLSRLGRWNAAKAYYHQAMVIAPNSTAGRMAIEAVEKIDTYNARYGWVYPLDNPAQASPFRAEEASKLKLVPSAGVDASNGGVIYTAQLEREVEEFSEAAEYGEPTELAHSERLLPVAEPVEKNRARDPLKAVDPAPDSYLKEVAATNEGVVFYWPLESMPLKVYVAPFPKGENANAHNLELAQQLVLEAVQPWQQALDNKLTVQFCEKPDVADVQIHWVKRLKLQPVGGLFYQQNGMTHMTMKAASTGQSSLQITMDIALTGVNEPQREMALLRQTLAHEWGHALGLTGHSPYSGDLMYFSIQAPNATQDGLPQLSPRDVQTIRLLYQHPKTAQK